MLHVRYHTLTGCRGSKRLLCIQIISSIFGVGLDKSFDLYFKLDWPEVCDRCSSICETVSALLKFSMHICWCSVSNPCIE